ncbi:MAG: DUF1549 and DUF1553 domain-containing protein [Planctomycetaceae bacterium]
MIGRRPTMSFLCAPLRLCAFASIAFASFIANVVLAAEVEPPDPTAYEEPPLADVEREHWAYRPLAKVELPRVDDENANWCRNEIDRFILAAIEAKGLAPANEADRHTLLRRVTFDLTGLPPTPAEIAAFLADDSPDAYEKVVDRLLASRGYAERAAQHWLDLARFAESDGFESDILRLSAWRYRDWVIDALDADMPYDEFVRMQIAGDRIRPDDPAALVATGFLLCEQDMPDINSQIERRHTFLNGMASTVGSAFLGLQFGCAQCHDHKYDPISQADFYRLRAFFDNTDLFTEKPLPGEGAGNDKKKPPTARAIFERDDRAPASHVMLRGSYRRPGPAIVPASPRFLAHALDPVSLDAKMKSAEQDAVERRIALAEWLSAADNPLATRVIVNRLWQQHFGRGIVATPSDFGIMGDAPTHPKLLDWLAAELPRRGWKLKALHRLMVTSATYRQASRGLGKGGERRETASGVWAGMARRRLDGEEIRDALLLASGRLNRKSGGPSVRPPLPEEVVRTLSKNLWEVTPDEADYDRRSIYLFVRRNLAYPFFAAFDKPDAAQSCPRRNRSTTAPQALTLLNSELTLDAARSLAELVIRESDDEARRIEACWLRAFGRPPRAEEAKLASDFLKDDAAALRRENRRAVDLPLPLDLPADADIHAAAAWTDLCLSLVNSNEFLYVD